MTFQDGFVQLASKNLHYVQNVITEIFYEGSNKKELKNIQK